MRFSRRRIIKSSFKEALTPSGIVWNLVKMIIYIVMLLFACTYIYSFVFLFINSFKSAPEYMRDVFSLPKVFDGGNYGEILSEMEFKGYGLFGMLGNTMILVVWQIATAITFPHMASYALARYETKFGKILEAIVWATMAIPVVGASASWMWFFNATGLYDTFAGLFIMGISGLGFGSILLKNFYAGMSPAYREAAYMDGASEWTVFTRIYYPQAKAITMITVINTFIGAWNDYMGPYMYLPSKPTLALGLQQLQSQFVSYGNDYPVMFAGILLSTIPILLLYIKFSDEILSNAGIGMK